MRSQDSSYPAPPATKSGTLDTTIKAWLSAMTKAGRIKPGGKLVFVNKNTGAPDQ